MTSLAGAAAGATAGGGLLLVGEHVRARRRPSLDARVAPYLRPRGAVLRVEHDDAFLPAVLGLAEPTVRAVAARLDRLLGGRASVRARLVRAGSPLSVEQFRLEQVVWSACCFVLAIAFVALVTVQRGAPSVVVGLSFCGGGIVAGLVGREHELNRAVARRTARIDAELPTVAELLALAVAAGEGVVGGLTRVARCAEGDLALEVRAALEDMRLGSGLADAFCALADRVADPAVRRFVDGLLVAVERGTPLADVLHAQATDANDARRRRLMEIAGRREIAMLVPVVFVILPVTVVFALFPGFYGLSLAVP